MNGTVVETGWPDSQPSGPTVWLNGFAAHPDVIAVAASSSLATKSAYSNWGREISVCAPSNNAPPRTFPRLTAPVAGRGIVTTDRVGSSGYSSTDYTDSFGGTSSACPTVAGVAALVLSAHPNLTAGEVRQILEATADKIVDPAPDPQLGHALGTYDALGHSPWFGHGRVNAFRAVSEAWRRRHGAGARTIRKTSAPARAIPDDDAAGVRDVIAVAETLAVASARVSVDLAHTYAGDLRLTLVAPSGASVVLHDRNGGNACGIRRSFDISTTPGFAAVMGQITRGNWTLWVQDLAAVDTGTLNRWELELGGLPAAVEAVEERPGTMIPDNSPAGIERILAVNGVGLIRDIEVAVDITHTCIGDLTITLVSPAGTPAILHGRNGGSQDNLMVTYSASAMPALAALRGQSMQGAWTLRVADLEPGDVGKLNRWALRIVR